MATTPSTKLDQLLRKIQPCQFASYQEFMRTVIIEALANTNFTFEEINYDFFALNREIFQRINKEKAAFYKFLANTRPDIISDGPERSPHSPWNPAAS